VAPRERGGGVLARVIDEDATVAEDAVQMTCELLAAGFQEGSADALRSLAARVCDLTERHRRLLGDALRRTPPCAEPAAETAALRELELRLAPTTWSERLRLQVGTWTADIGDSPAPQDEALALEGLSDPTMLRAELPWLLSAEAVRASSFAHALGRVDVEGEALAALREVARLEDEGAAGFVARYLAGMQVAGRRAATEAALAALEGDASGAYLLLLVSVLTAATPERLDRVEDAIRRGDLRGTRLYAVGHLGRWLWEISDERLLGFVETLLEHGGDEGAVAVVLVARHRLSTEHAPIARWRRSVTRALRASAASAMPGAGYAWALCAVAMVELGEVSEMVDLAVTALGRPRGALRDAWHVLHAAQTRDIEQTWEALARRLERDDEAARHFVQASRFFEELLAWPADRMLAWVGTDVRRAAVAIQLVKFDDKSLHPILRALVERFGAEGPTAREIALRMTSTDRPVASLAAYMRSRLKAVRSWLEDGNREVRSFARDTERTLTERLEFHEAEEAEERRRWGT
jgi:hypothetical protein